LNGTDRCMIRIGVIGLGYVGLPLALAFGKKFPGTVGFDILRERVDSLSRGEDLNGEESRPDLLGSNLKYTTDAQALGECNFFVVTVPTPVDGNKQPDLTPVRLACETVGAVMKRGAVIVFESTVYPGVTEDFCAPILARVSGLSRSDFKLGYSPERINPGDKEHTLTKIKKVVSAEDPESLRIVTEVYGAVITAGLHLASSIKVAEAAKVIENTQRDLNIALMNELAIIFDRMGISTREVLEAAGTKWNFLRFSPGLVGGHCIGVDPYYLTMKAQQLGYHPEVILAGRKINDGMGAWIAQRIVKEMVVGDLPVKGSKVAVLGVTFKENVSDIRNSRVPDIVAELKSFGVEVLIHDPLAANTHVEHEYGFALSSWEQLKELDGIVLAVGHSFYREMPLKDLLKPITRSSGVVVDVKSILKRSAVSELGHRYWEL
jgi:UDP-N-acetyl-D-galactosamine dehydrogenase